MSRTRKKQHHAVTAEIVVFLLLFFLLTGTVLLRFRSAEGTEFPDLLSETQTEEEMSEEQTADEADAGKTPDMEMPESPDGQPAAGENAAPNPEEDVFLSGTESSSADSAAPAATARSEKAYRERTYQLVSDIVFTMRSRGEEGETSIRELLTELKEEDAELGALWEGIAEYWLNVCRGLTLTPYTLPDGLPQDSSLAIVVLGFQLLYDGEMAPELSGRCYTALNCAKKYPNAWLLVTGGGTAAGNREATEAGVMAEWFKEQGIAPERILVESSSLTTDQNAAFSCRILAEQVPEVRELAIVSSDYHVPLGSMLFQEAALLYAWENDCEAPYRVVSNACFQTSGNPEYSDPKHIAGDIWVLADPTY